MSFEGWNSQRDLERGQIPGPEPVDRRQEELYDPELQGHYSGRFDIPEVEYVSEDDKDQFGDFVE